MAIDTSMRTLVVDDHRIMLGLLCDVLRQSTENDDDVMAKLRAGNFGLLASDWSVVVCPLLPPSGRGPHALPEVAGGMQPAAAQGVDVTTVDA